jgi:integration host factor subunit beta
VTKAEIVDTISREVGITKKDIAYVIDLFFEKIKAGLASGDHFELRGFGTFGIRTRMSRIARNPKTGDKVSVPERKVPYFRAGKELKEMVTYRSMGRGGSSPSGSPGTPAGGGTP